MKRAARFLSLARLGTATALSLISIRVIGKESTETTAPQIIEPSCWKITFPVAGPKGKALETANPEFSAAWRKGSFPSLLSRYCFKTDEGMVFHTEYTGITTSKKTDYSRTELREMQGAEETNWTLATTGVLEARLKISEMAGGASKVIFMQIHGKAPSSEPLLKCIWEKGAIRLLTKTGPRLKDLSRQPSYAAVSLNEWFECTIRVDRTALSIAINGKIVESYGRDVLDSWPEQNTYYFKAGNYLQSSQPGAAGTVIFSSLRISHGNDQAADSEVSPSR